ncbi:MAG: 3-phosphoshikimate 1-carboxyvinyltransferase [Synergistaceae bacterium]|jgi:3-phosphoshikimate 1-carboxyvinyltransferase|nr:3-phosphoshikimate 1-carboxyvinyltransferase [Synergistaceae bacterium]
MNDVKVIERCPSGVVTPPPSKSLCHRAVICAALSRGECVIGNFGRSDDVDATLSGVSSLMGVETRREGGSLRVYPRGAADDVCSDRVAFCNESGSTLRFLLPIASLDGRPAVFTGKEGLMRRPLGVYEKIFRESGVAFAREPGRILIEGALRPGIYETPGDVSSQFISGLLFALPTLGGDSEIRLTSPLESRRYADMTIDVMRAFGVEIAASDSGYHIRGGQRYIPADYRVEADYSQAAFFLAAAALGRDVSVAGLERESIQGDAAILGVLRDMGVGISWSGGTVTVRAGCLRAVTADAREIPDLVPPIATLCCFCDGTSRIVNAGRLRFKESDRLSALSRELGNLGADIVETEDSLVITGHRALGGGAADSWGDHRIAMSMALAAIGCKTPVRLTGWRSVDKSYPDFWRDFEGGTL